MKKVNMTFIVTDETYAEANNEMTWGNNENAAVILSEAAETSYFDVEDINEAWIDARPEKIFIVTYVGLSDNDYFANGYSSVRAFKTFEDAKESMQRWIAAEKQNLKDEGFEYEILEDYENEFRISWSGQGEQVRMEIHEITLQ